MIHGYLAQNLEKKDERQITPNRPRPVFQLFEIFSISVPRILPYLLYF